MVRAEIDKESRGDIAESSRRKRNEAFTHVQPLFFTLEVLSVLVSLAHIGARPSELCAKGDTLIKEKVQLPAVWL